mgnify:CR=1 FL=1
MTLTPMRQDGITTDSRSTAASSTTACQWQSTPTCPSPPVKNTGIAPYMEITPAITSPGTRREFSVSVLHGASAN